MLEDKLVLTATDALFGRNKNIFSTINNGGVMGKEWFLGKEL
jgi:hypothetical protein